MGAVRALGVATITLVVTAVLSAQAVVAIENMAPGAPEGTSLVVVAAVAVGIGAVSLRAYMEGGD